MIWWSKTNVIWTCTGSVLPSLGSSFDSRYPRKHTNFRPWSSHFYYVSLVTLMILILLIDWLLDWVIGWYLYAGVILPTSEGSPKTLCNWKRRRCWTTAVGDNVHSPVLRNMWGERYRLLFIIYSTTLCQKYTEILYKCAPSNTCWVRLLLFPFLHSLLEHTSTALFWMCVTQS